MAQNSPSSIKSNCDVEVFYDGNCPICMFEIDMLQRLDKNRRILFTNISSKNFHPALAGLDEVAVMQRVHGRLADGTIIEGIEVFQQLYTAVGLGWLVAFSRIPGISYLLTIGYRLLAKHRVKLSGLFARRTC